MGHPGHMVIQLIILCVHLMQFIHLTLFVRCLPYVTSGVQCLTLGIQSLKSKHSPFLLETNGIMRQTADKSGQRIDV